MNIVNLNETGSANLRSGALELDLRVPNEIGAELHVRGLGSTPVSLVRVNASKWILPASGEAATVLVRAQREFFPSGTQVQLTVRNSNDQTVLIICPLTDVSELDEGILCELEPSGAGLTTVRAVKMDDVAPDPALTELSQAASFSARRLARQNLIATARRGLNLAIDVSASMVVHRDSGVLQALCEVVLGTDRGMGDGGDVPAYAVGHSIWPLEPLTSESAPGFGDVPQLRHPSTGLRAMQILRSGLVDGRDRTTVFLTDAPPPDLKDFAAADASTLGTTRLVIIGPRPDAATFDAFPGIAVVSPDLSVESLRSAAGHRAAMDRLVTDLIGSTFGGAS